MSVNPYRVEMLAWKIMGAFEELSGDSSTRDKHSANSIGRSCLGYQGNSGTANSRPVIRCTSNMAVPQIPGEPLHTVLHGILESAIWLYWEAWKSHLDNIVKTREVIECRPHIQNRSPGEVPSRPLLRVPDNKPTLHGINQISHNLKALAGTPDQITAERLQIAFFGYRNFKNSQARVENFT
jgi:hypothetical protein